MDHHQPPSRLTVGQAPVPFDPATWGPDRRQLAWESPLHPAQSFGQVARGLLGALDRLGVETALSAPATTPGLERFWRGGPPPGRLGVRFAYWPPASPFASDRLAVYCVRESTVVEPRCVAAISATAAVLYVPSRQNQAAFEAAGVAVPVRVLPHGIDPAAFPLQRRSRPAGRPFAFGTVGDLSRRKGIDVLVRAFLAEFDSDEPVRLCLKSRRPPEIALPPDPRIRVEVGFWGQERLLAFLADLDAFVLPSRGEGFGLCGLEAMATGLPLIATDWGGPSDYLDPTDTYPLGYRLVAADGTSSNGVRYEGRWAEPDEAHLRVQLRRVYEAREEAIHRGRRASARVHRDWTWAEAARRLLDGLDALATGTTPA